MLEVDETAKRIADLTSMTMQLTTDRATKEISKIVSLAQQEIKSVVEAAKGVPVMAIQIDKGPVKKLKSRASPLLPTLVINAKLGLNTMLVGPAGCGKTTMAEQLAEALDLNYRAICFSAGASEAWLFGRQTPTGFIEGAFAKTYREGGVFLADEIDAADANLLLAINTALSHTRTMNPMNGEELVKHPNFVMVAAANTNGVGASHVYTGRTRLDRATLERFEPVAVDYDSQLEKQLCPEPSIYKYLTALRKEFAKNQYDEPVSTRAFIKFFLRWNAGVEPEDIFSSMTLNWSDAARDLARSKFTSSGIKKRELEKTPDPVPSEAALEPKKEVFKTATRESKKTDFLDYVKKYEKELESREELPF